MRLPAEDGKDVGPTNDVPLVLLFLYVSALGVYASSRCAELLEPNLLKCVLESKAGR